ncbi:hypothetical protein OPQ81_008326 [Rhizoctonia solani]|nr:hypothetical protein OPQ81_008326 [Rhizoctonia solani]
MTEVSHNFSRRSVAIGSIDPGLSEPLINSRFSSKSTGQAFPKLITSLPSHNLDFEYPNFLTYEQLPPNGTIPPHGWVFLGTVVSNVSLWRPFYHVRDTEGKEIFVAFYLGSANPLQKELAQLSVGQMMSFRGAFQHQFMDGQVGLRIEDEDLENLKVLPCSVQKLQAINNQLCLGSNKCKICGKDNASLQCSNCKSRYCSRDCQMEDWKAKPDPHSKLCDIIEHLRSLNILFVK